MSKEQECCDPSKIRNYKDLEGEIDRICKVCYIAKSF